jgi:chitodextrinase
MISFPNTRGVVSGEMSVAPNAVISAEGQALVNKVTNGVGGAAPSTGDAGEVFIGLAVSQQMTLTSVAKVDEAIQPASNTVKLSRTPSAGTLAIYDEDAKAPIALAGAVTLVGDVVTLEAATVGHKLKFTFKFVPTVTEARQLQGDVWPGGPAGAVVNQVGYINEGPVFTDQFVTTVDWNAPNPVVKLGANGQLTIGGTGTTVNCAVTSVPSASSPFLGITLL